MKHFVIFLVISGLLSAGLTLVFFAEQPLPPDPIREEYADVFTRFGLHAEDAYKQFDDASGLDILAVYDSDGLRLLLQYKDLIIQLQPYLDTESLISLCRTDGDLLAKFLTIFQPEIVADIYNQFGPNGLRYVLDEPERYFLLQIHGQSLVELANVKGPIIFDLVQTYTPEFLELYYDDAFFNAIHYFGLNGFLAIKTYRGLATTIFSLFSEDERLASALQTYGYQQVIPVLYYFYQQQDSSSLQERLTAIDSAGPHQGNSPEMNSPDSISSLQRQQDRVHWALQQIDTRGNTFLRQFSIADDGSVTPLPVVSFTNFLEEILLGEAQYLSSSPQTAEQLNEASPAACEQLHAVLDILGLLPSETLLTRQARCNYLRSGLASATTRSGIEGLLALDEEQELVEQYGPEVVPFVAHYGRDGLHLLRQTEGTILVFARKHGPDLVEYALSYGPELLDLVDEFGNALIDAIRMTQGEIVPYVKSYGRDIFQLLNHPEGQALLRLAPILGESVIDYTLRYPDDFPRVLFKYGRISITAIKQYNDKIIAFARQYGDDALYYAGRYGEHTLRLLKSGRAGITLLRVLPETKLQDTQFLGKSIPRLLFDLLITSPRTLHRYIGQLGHQYVPLHPRYIQIAFWWLLNLCVLLLLGGFYRIVKGLFWG